MTFEADIESLLTGLRAEHREHPSQKPTTRLGHNIEAGWKNLDRVLPREVRKLLGTIDILTLRVQALETIEHELFGWIERRDDRRSLDASTVISEWRAAISGSRRAATLKMVRRMVDDAKHVAQVQKLESHAIAASLPTWQTNPPVRDHVLHTRDVSRGTPTYGVRSYPEATPVEVPVLVVRRWMERIGKTRPACWDLTAGSGTVSDVITAIFGGRVIGTDIAFDTTTTVYGDIRVVGEHARHGRRSTDLLGNRIEVEAVTHPDLVFLHPPSRGWPACCWVYGREADRALRQDLCVLLDRREYVKAIATAISGSTARLAPGGLISVVVPEYLRVHQEIEADLGVADDLVAELKDICAVLDRHAIVDGAPVKQASLGTTRGPVEHLILSKKVSS